MENKTEIDNIGLRNIALLNTIENLKDQIRAYETTVSNLRLQLEDKDDEIGHLMDDIYDYQQRMTG